MSTNDFNVLFKNLVRGSHPVFRPLHGSRISSDGYPFYDIVILCDNNYRIDISTPGFSRDELEITVDKSVLTVCSLESESQTEIEEFLVKNIHKKGFERQFILGDYIEVTKADYKDGILSIHLKRDVPEDTSTKINIS